MKVSWVERLLRRQKASTRRAAIRDNEHARDGRSVKHEHARDGRLLKHEHAKTGVAWRHDGVCENSPIFGKGDGKFPKAPDDP